MADQIQDSKNVVETASSSTSSSSAVVDGNKKESLIETSADHYKNFLEEQLNAQLEGFDTIRKFILENRSKMVLLPYNDIADIVKIFGNFSKKAGDENAYITHFIKALDEIMYLYEIENPKMNKNPQQTATANSGYKDVMEKLMTALKPPAAKGN